MSVEADGSWDTDTYPTRIKFEVKTTDTLLNALQINSDAEIKLGQYGSGTFTGTSAYYLIADSSGNIIEKTPAQVRSDIGAGTGSGTVTGVGATSPINSSGGTSPTISIDNATGTTVGAAAIEAGTGISVSDSNGVYTITNSSPSSGGTITGSGTSGRLAKFNTSTALTDSRIFESGTGTFIKDTTSYPLTIQNDGSASTVKFEASATANESNIQIKPGTVSKPGLTLE